jgi:hypothetical protein
MEIKRVAAGPKVETTYERMLNISALIEPTRSELAVVEYSALLGLGATLMAASMGVEPTRKNVSRILAQIVEKLVPILEAELKKK